ncbi:MAG: uracil phosphoribosyltransferase [Bacteroidota bacterium]
MAKRSGPVVLDHPLIQHQLTILRNRRTAGDAFRAAMKRISTLIAAEVTRDVKLSRTPVVTPLAKTRGYSVSETVAVISVLRAGLGMVEGFLSVLPDARVGHVGLYRNEETLEPVEYYTKFPRGLQKSLVLLLDPMLATGGSSDAAITFLKGRGARRIRLVTVVAAPEGAGRVARAHPDVTVYTASLDRKLNAAGYIVPGLGDAGDRLFGTTP